MSFLNQSKVQAVRSKWSRIRTVCILMQHPSILHQTLPFHHRILKPFQMVPQIDCHPGHLLTWTANKRCGKNPSMTMASWFSSLPTSLVFEIFIFWDVARYFFNWLVSVSRYICLSLFSYIVFLKANMFLLPLPPEKLPHNTCKPFHFWISKATLWFSTDQGFPHSSSTSMAFSKGKQRSHTC